MSNVYVYGHWTKDTNELFYIGLGSTKYRYRTKSSRNPYWKNKVSKHEFIADIIDYCPDLPTAQQYEINLIRKYTEEGISLTNMTAGGEGVLNLCEEAKNKISIKLKNNKNSIGFKHSEETKQLISNKRKELNYKPSEDALNKASKIKQKSVRCVTTNTVYSSMTEAAKDNNLTVSEISKQIRGEKLKLNGLVFEFYGPSLGITRNKGLTEKQRIAISRNKGILPIRDITTGVVYNTYTEAAQATNISRQGIMKHCRNLLKNKMPRFEFINE